MKKLLFSTTFVFLLLSVFLISCDKSETANLVEQNLEEISNPITPSHLKVDPDIGVEPNEAKKSSSSCCIDCTASVVVTLPSILEYDLWIRGVCTDGTQGPLIGHYDEVNTPTGVFTFPMIDEQYYQFSALSSAGALTITVTDFFGPSTITIGDMVFPQPTPPSPPTSNAIYQHLNLDCNNYTTSNCYVFDPMSNQSKRVCCFAKLAVE